MSQTLADLVTDLSQEDHEKQLERIRKIRKNKYSAKPGAQKHKKKAAQKKENKRKQNLLSRVDNLSEEERQELIRMLEEEQDVEQDQ